ncbi:MAG: ribosomal RNA small subunit methyltransferase A [Candidatus Nitrosotenuis sp.]
MKRQRLGQHFLLSQNIAKKIVDSAGITKKDVVLEVGTGRGILVPYLCSAAGHVVSVEKDGQLYSDAMLKFSQIPNLELVYGDGFEVDVDFDVFVSNLPYSESKNAIEWLAQKKFRCAAIMVQEEFAEKLLFIGKKTRAVAVIANHSFEMRKVLSVNKNNFEPPPKVDSVVLLLKHKKNIPPEVIDAVNKLFSYKRKTVGNILKKFGKKMQSDKRLEELTVDEIIKIARQIA